MDGVYNRKLFAKKSEEARNKLRQMGGVQPMPQKMGGIMASSPELMQAAAMRRPVVLPSSTTPSPQPVPAPQPQMLPPSSPLPNIAGIPQAQAPAPRPMAQKPGVAKFDEGGLLDYRGPRSGMTLREKIQRPGETTMRMFQRGVQTPLTFGFRKAFEYGQKAITTEDPTKLGLPEGANMAEPAKALEDPEAAAADIIADTVPKDQQTGDTQKDLRTAASMTGIESVPAEAEIDELNKAIFGAKLAGALAGDYVNPATGQAVRPSAGKRVAQAAVEGLAVARETEERRAKQEAALAAAKMKAAGKGTSGKLPPNLKVLVDMFEGRVSGGEAIDKVAAQFNEAYGDNTGTMIMQYIRDGVFAPQPQQTEQVEITPEQRLEMVKYALQQQPENRKAILEQAQKDGVNIEGL